MKDKRAKYLEMLREVFIEVFNDESIVLNNSTNAEDIDEWDSLQHIMLIMGTEKKFEFDINRSLIVDASFENLSKLFGEIRISDEQNIFAFPPSKYKKEDLEPYVLNLDHWQNMNVIFSNNHIGLFRKVVPYEIY